MLFKEFEWDRENIVHILRHRVTPEEVEEACLNKPHVRRIADRRYFIYGVTDSGRYLFVVGRNKGKGFFRTITARDMTGRERSLYKRR